MARLMTGAQKYTHGEWVVANERKYAAAEGERAACERLQDQICAVIDDTNFVTTKLEAEVDRQFDKREKDVKFWESELERKTEQVGVEIDELSNLQVRLASAIQFVQQPLQITKHCLATREERVGVDRVRDAAEVELEREAEMCEGVLALLSRSHSQVEEQIRLLRKCRYNLEKDLKDKYACLSIDSQARLAVASSSSVSPSAAAQLKWSSVGEWARHSEACVGEAEVGRTDAVGLRGVVAEVLRSTHEDLSLQRARSNTALCTRVQQTNDANAKLHQHLALVREEMNVLEGRTKELERTLVSTRQPLDRAAQRLGEREARPNVELCADGVQVALGRQANGMQQTADRLTDALTQAHRSLNALRSQQVTLEDEIKVKMRSVEVDEMRCATLANGIHYQPF